MKLKIISISLIITLLSAMLCACSSGTATQDENGNATSALSNYPVAVYNVNFDACPTKVACLSDSIADILHALGYDSLLVAKATGNSSEYTSSLPEIGTATALDMDTITSLGIDFIVSQEAISSSQLFKLEQKGIKSVSFTNAKTFDELQAIYTNLGTILGGAKDGYENAYKKSNDIFITLENINKLVGDKEKKSACYMYDLNGTVVTGDTLANNLMQLAGINNIASERTGGHMDMAEIASANPQFIFCSVGLRDSILSNGTLQGTSAVKKSNVIEMDSSLLNRQGSTLIEGITFIADNIYPSLVTKAADSNTASESSETTSSQATDNTTQKSKKSTKKSSKKTKTKTKVRSSKVVLRKGDQGSEVRKLQTRLKELGFLEAKPNGIFGNKTLKAVKDYQYTSGFYVTGKVTQKLLNEIYSDKAAKLK